MQINIRGISQEEVAKAISFVWSVFQEFEAPDYSNEGIEEFYKTIYSETYLSKLCIYGAFWENDLVGVIATRSEGSHIALFFVDGTHHRQGMEENYSKLYEEIAIPTE